MALRPSQPRGKAQGHQLRNSHSTRTPRGSLRFEELRFQWRTDSQSLHGSYRFSERAIRLQIKRYRRDVVSHGAYTKRKRRHSRRLEFAQHVRSHDDADGGRQNYSAVETGCGRPYMRVRAFLEIMTRAATGWLVRRGGDREFHARTCSLGMRAASSRRCHGEAVISADSSTAR